MSEKVYINGIFIKEKETKFGKIIACSVKADSFIEEIKKHTNAKGYVNFDLLQRKEADKNGNTHYAVLNTFQKSETNRNGITTQDNGDLPF